MTNELVSREAAIGAVTDNSDDVHEAAYERIVTAIRALPSAVATLAMGTREELIALVVGCIDAKDAYLSSDLAERVANALLARFGAGVAMPHLFVGGDWKPQPTVEEINAATKIIVADPVLHHVVNWMIAAKVESALAAAALAPVGESGAAAPAWGGVERRDPRWIASGCPAGYIHGGQPIYARGPQRGLHANCRKESR